MKLFVLLIFFILNVSKVFSQEDLYKNGVCISGNCNEGYGVKRYPICSDYAYYKGEFKNGYCHGKGKIEFAECQGGGYYEGNFVNGQKEGYGVQFYGKKIGRASCRERV